MKATTKGELAEMIRTVCDAHDNEEILLFMAECDLGVIEAICRLVPESALKELELDSSTALWTVDGE